MNQQQQQVVAAYAARHGLLWRNALYNDWQAGQCSPLLAGLFDQYGPAWPVNLYPPGIN